jgi:predicted permease
MFSSPTAAAAFVMAVSMKADGQLTANVIALSTLGAAFSVSAMIYVLTLAGLV